MHQQHTHPRYQCFAVVLSNLTHEPYIDQNKPTILSTTDLNFLEDSAGGPDLPIAYLPSSNKVTMLQMDSKLNLEQFEKVVQLAAEGCKKIHEILVKEVCKLCCFTPSLHAN